VAKILSSSAENLGRAIQLRRVELGMKRRDLAIAAGLSYPYVSEIENGQKEPSAKALRQLADALELALADLVSLTDRLGIGSESPSLLLDSDAARPQAQLSVDDRRPSRHGNDEAFFAMALPSELTTSGRDGMLERWISDTVARLVHAELTRWATSELPELFRAEVEAAMRRRDAE
jgi:transcriptional regulator with XRE-family HTH domain